MDLRVYQTEAVNALWKHIREREDNPVLVLPTGAGKGVILAQIAKDVVAWGGRLAIVSHVKELLEQTAKNIQMMAPEIPIGVYSAGLGSKDTGYAVTVAGIQSCYEKASEFGKLDIIAIDEAHRIPEDGEGMYRTFLDAAKAINPLVRLIGLTATPYRLGTGMIAKPENLLNKVAYDIGVRQLIVQGYLSPLKSKSSVEKVDVSSVSVRGGEFVQGELQKAVMGDEGLVVRACCDMVARVDTRKAALVFCAGIDHAKMVAQFLKDLAGEDQVKTIFGDTPSDERAATIQAFRDGKLKYLVNVDVLTTGFDAPNVDCVAVLRPTMSPGLWVQMVGRGFRLAPGKTDCLVLDFGGNLMRHGPVDRIVIDERRRGAGEPWKECPVCQEVVPIGCDVCPDCGGLFPRNEVGKREVNHDVTAADKSILSEPEDVASIQYVKHRKMKDGRFSITLRVIYSYGLAEVSEFVCFEHQGFARDKAAKWWRARSSEPTPLTVDGALNLIKQTGIKEPRKIALVSDGKYLRVDRAIDFRFNDKPQIVESGETKEPFGMAS